jgi:NRAMP (natural resistance-associated macrophage protein)-like metal ion transporter
VTGAADDDPSGIATYSQVGAKFGYALLWMIWLVIPLMVAIQMVSALVGRVTGRDLADNLRRHYPPRLVQALMLVLFVANVINLGADISAMAAATQLLIGGTALVYAIVLALLSLGLQVFIPFSRYSPFLKALTLSLFAYVGTVFVVKVHWGEVVRQALLPTFHFSREYAVAIVAVLGTTISPYLFSWQAAQEVEEIKSSEEREPLKKKPSQGADAILRIRIDTTAGMIFSNVVAFFIILTAAAVLHAHGKTDIQSSAEAASALKPLAGRFAFWLFALGIIGTGLLALPVLAGATAYAIAGAWQQPYGLERKLREAPWFYGVLIGAMLIAVTLNLVPIDPMKALYGSAVINGVAAVPLMVAIVLLAQSRRAMGEFVIHGWLRALAWLATLVMAIAAVAMFVI